MLKLAWTWGLLQWAAGAPSEAVRRWPVCRSGRAGRRAGVALLIGVLAGGPTLLAVPEPARPVIQSAAEVDYPPFCFLDESGQATGFAIELLRAALDHVGHDVAFRTGTWAEVRGLLERAEVQALPLVGRTPEREAVFDFTVPYLSLLGAIVVRADSHGIDGLDSLRGRRVAVMRGDNAEEFLRRGDFGVLIQTTPTFLDALRELADGRHEAVVIQRLVAARLIQDAGLVNLRIVNRPLAGFRQDFCFAVRAGDRPLLALLNDGLARAVADGAVRQLQAKWFSSLELPSHSRIVVGGDHNYPPYEFLDPSGHPTGYNIDLVRAIAVAVGLDIDIRLGPWSQVRAELEQGQIDLLPGVLYSSDRAVALDFSPAHIVNHYVGVVRRGAGPPPETVAQLAGRRIVVQRGDIMHDFARQHGLEDRLTALDNQEEALRELVDGRHDCALLSRRTALHWIQVNGWRELEVGRRPLLSPEYCLAVPKGERALLEQLNEGLRVLQDTGAYRRIHDKWMAGTDGDPPRLAVVLRHVALGAVPLAVLAALVFAWFRSLRRQVAARTVELRESVEWQRAMIACSPVAIYSIDLAGHVLTWNASAERMFGWAAGELIGRPLPIVPEVARREFDELRQQVLESGGFTGREVMRQRKDGTRFDVRLSAAPIHDAAGQIVGMMSAAEDITERKRAEAERERLLSAIAQTGEVVLITDPEGILLYANPAFEQVTGFTRQDALGQPARLLAGGPHDEEMWAAITSGHNWEGQLVDRRQDGAPCVLSTTVSPVRDVGGRIVNHVAVMRDITRELQLTTQLQQAQRVEAVGRLAGGVAHDYNNMLGVIIGYTELAMGKLPAGDPLQADLAEVLRAARRSAEITRQLLAFARQQPVNPQVLDLNTVIGQVLRMLRRLIGEDIDLVWQPGNELWPVRIDPAQIDQILTNLCLNARDAIRGVGRVTIETGVLVVEAADGPPHPILPPGEFVQLAVADNGCGMPPEILERVFEPFYTTKEMGQGTGLGLPTVYGIVKQNEGFVEVSSEPGQGTRIRVYLPRHHGPVRDVSATSPDPDPPQPGQGETVLLVEDEAAILRMSAAMLRKLGYRVLPAASPKEAMHLVDGLGDGGIDLLVTDVIMPGMNGRELADRLRARFPDLATLFMSGYTADVIARRGFLEDGVHFIQKPFTLRDIGEKVKAVLAR